MLQIPIKPLVLIGPSGSGRAAIAFRLTCQLPHKFDRVVTMTSRTPRPMQKQGYHFYFRSQQQMLHRNNNKQFVTFVLSPHNHYYGTHKYELGRIIQKNKIPILKVTLQSYIKNVMDELDCNALFIKVPNIQQVQKRLQFGPYTDEEIKQKIKNAGQQQRQASKYFREQNIIENNDIEQALMKIKSRLFELY